LSSAKLPPIVRSARVVAPSPRSVIDCEAFSSTPEKSERVMKLMTPETASAP
jgi:hypothetical protein